LTPKARLVDRAAEAVASRVDRRGFLRRTAMVGSALAVVPGRYLLRPGTAYAAVCSCSGSSCGCGSACCDGYTEFCCTITGRNSCPPGTTTGGWWKADGSGLCSGAPRYYLDCNVVPPNNPCSCGCANGRCTNRKACCTRFRYGQCHQEITTMGPIMCRVVTCTPPWQLDPSCTTAVLTDNNTRFHDAPCLHEAPVVPPHPFEWYLRNTNAPGAPDAAFSYGMSDYVPLVGDWTGQGFDSIGVWDPASGTFYLRSSNTPGPPDISVSYGVKGYVPLVGDWTGQGFDSIGVWDPSAASFYLRNTNSPGPPDVVAHYGASTYRPVVGDWNGDGTTTIGVVA